MNFKSNIRLFITYIIVLISVVFGVVSVFGTDLVFLPQIDNSKNLSKNIFIDDRKMQSTYLLFSSRNDLSDYKLNSSCKNKSKFLGSKNDNYIFRITLLEKCNNSVVFIETKEKNKIKNSFVKLNVFSKSYLFEIFSDQSNLSLERTYKIIKNNIKELNNKQQNKSPSFENLKNSRKLLEFKYQEIIIKEILDSRKLKYISPVLGYNLSKKKNQIPNAGRPYRSNYTDGIHHGWDVPAPNKTDVIALDYGKIVRIVKGFVFNDLSKLKLKGNISDYDKVHNLDTLRGNQVWLKTSKGDVVFYSHLSKVSDDIKVGDLVYRGQVLGKTGISGVPDKDYKNYHLHFPIMKNPYTKTKVGKYTINDYLNWNWYFKGKSLDYIIENQNNVFN